MQIARVGSSGPFYPEFMKHILTPIDGPKTKRNLCVHANELNRSIDACYSHGLKQADYIKKVSDEYFHFVIQSIKSISNDYFFNDKDGILPILNSIKEDIDNLLEDCDEETMYSEERKNIASRLTKYNFAVVSKCVAFGLE